jgi:hypothetical protein
LQWHHVLRRPSLQDLRRLKFTKQLFRKAKWMYKMYRQPRRCA